MAEITAEPGVTKRQWARDRPLLMHGQLAPGQVIPPERELAETLGVSRPTLRAAVDQLVAEGYLERRQGSGTYVTHPKVATPLTLMSFSEDMQRRGMRPGGRVLSLRAQFAGAEMCHRLRISPREQVWSIRRLRTADDQPMAIEHAFLPRAMLPELRAADLTNRSMYDHLRQVGVRVGSASQSIEPTVTSEEESELLDVPALSPAFLFERTTHDTNGRAIEFVRSVYRGDRYRLLAELRPRFT